MAALLLFLLTGCCGKDSPSWLPLEPLYLDGEAASVELADRVTDDKGVEILTADADPEVLVEISGTTLVVTPQPDWDGVTEVRLVAEDRCGNRSATTLEVHSGAAPTTTGTGTPGACATTVTWSSAGSPDAVAIAGSFNDWDPDADRLTFDGTKWTIDLDLPPGNYPYKLVELDQDSFGATESWSCDPDADLIQCDPGFPQPWQNDWRHACGLNVESCNSLLVVQPCGPPRLEVEALDIDVAGRSVHVEVAVSPGAGGAVSDVEVLLDGAATQAQFDGERVVIDASGLTPARHTIRVRATDAAGNEAHEAYVPFWLDGWQWEDGVVYFAFVDRLRNGDPSLDGGESATAVGGAYEGGDLKGVRELLPYLDDLGVSILWLSNLQDNAEGPWAGDCGLTYAGYHAYWPDQARAPEEHFGDDAEIRALIDEAHARGMRVIMDWVANHVHEDHPYYADHPEWFNDFQGCKDSVDGQLNFDRIPETCWFAPYLPDIDYSHPDALVTMVDDAIWWAETYELDGLRADAVKHMSKAVTYDLARRIDQRIEHVDAGGDQVFWTVGETFDSYDRIAAYIGDDQLSGQFDFPLYYSIRDGFLYGNSELASVLWSWDTSRSVFGDAPMSTFLGNHDVLRFVTDGTTGWQDVCDGGNIRVAPAPTDPWPYDRLKLAWSFLFSMPGIPLVYYGDELGLPGNPDPDNRQPLWWHTGDLAGVTDVDGVASRVDPLQAGVVRHVAALATARAAHPALRTGGWTEWWREYDLVAYARSADGDHALVVLNRSEFGRDLTNGLSFAGLPQGTYEDALTGQTWTSAGDQITVDVPARGSRVLLWRP